MKTSAMRELLLAVGLLTTAVVMAFAPDA